ncbi:MAG TPA: metalloprotease family protein [Bacteroidales bacterium]|nr:metalloprotease family protein [Bacteroidales bacterium]
MNNRLEKIKTDPAYNHLLTIQYNDIVPFVFEYLKKYTLPVILSYLFITCSLIWMVITRIGITGDFPFPVILLHSLIGFILIPLLLILPHELLHVLPYWFTGARDIRIGAEPGEFYFYVTAHNHPVGNSGFQIIAITPFIIISLILVPVSFFLTPLWQWSIVSAFFMHNTMCAGDLALINFFYLNRDKKIITWDNAEEKKAYFYEVPGT